MPKQTAEKRKYTKSLRTLTAEANYGRPEVAAKAAKEIAKRERAYGRIAKKAGK